MLTDDQAVILTLAEFDALPEYSLSAPTGTFVGKRWKRRLWDEERRRWGGWLMGEYEPDPQGRADYVQIRWREVLEVVP